MNAPDNNVWVYAIDHRDLERQQKARELLNQLDDSGETVIPWQVASEFVNCLRRFENRGVITASTIDRWVEWMIELFPIVTPQHTTIITALDLSRRYSLSHWESMLFAACVEAGVTTLYSEDLSNGVRYDSVLVVNPFAA